MKRLWCALLFLASVLPAAAQYVTLTGTLAAANGLSAPDYTISFTPTQMFFVAGTSITVNTSTFCSTTIDGTVHGPLDPQNPAVLSTSTTGTLPAGNYYVEYAWYDSAGNTTLVSPEVVQQLTAAGSLKVNLPSSGLPQGVVGMDVYIGTASGIETLQGSQLGTAQFNQAAPLASGSAVPAANTTICKQIANDAGWPTGTGYQVAFSDTSGNTVPGYPMTWQLLGPNSTINLSNGLPTYNGSVTYPSPILASPLNHNLQSISGPLNMSGYDVTGIRNEVAQSMTATVSINGATINGVVNAAMMPGTDIGMQVNYAFQHSPQCQAQYAAGDVGITNSGPGLCQVMIPPADYKGFITPIHMPSVSEARLVGYGAKLFPSGTQAGQQAIINTGVAADGATIEGLTIIMANSTTPFTIALARAAQHVNIKAVRVQGNHNNIAIVDLGANVVHITDCDLQQNLIGVDLEGSPGYASNNVTVDTNVISNNWFWGVSDGITSQFPGGWPLGDGSVSTAAGVTSHNLGNYISNNDLEGNGGYNDTVANPSNTTLFFPTVVPAVFLGYITADVVEKDYFEVTPYVRVQVGWGVNSGNPVATTYTALFTPNLTAFQGGTPEGPTVQFNYFTPDNTHPGAEIRLGAAVGTVITNNSELYLAGANETCAIDFETAVGSYIGPNSWTAGSQFCIEMAPTTNDAYASFVGYNHFSSAALDNSTLIFNPSGAGTANTGSGKVGLEYSPTGPPSPYNPDNGNTGNATCDPSWGNGHLYMSTGSAVLWVCKPDTKLSTAQFTAYNPSGTTNDGHSTWVPVHSN
jgi:hypothetical protein